MRRGRERVALSDLIALSARRERIRNVCIIAHVDHGKTSLADTLIASNGIISERLAGSLRFLDSTEDEMRRGITMQASAISLRFDFARRPAETPEPHLINLIDSPGHIDFSADVGTATRLCDGALVVVDAVEGVCIQTQTVLRQAWRERLTPVLVLNKLDRLCLELQLTPQEAHERLRRVVENVNAVCAALIANELYEEQRRGGNDGADHAEEDGDATGVRAKWDFDPVKGNVVFASALDGWGATLGSFARIWAQRLGLPAPALRKTLWGDFTLNAKTKKCLKIGPGNADAPTMFGEMVLQPIFSLYAASEDEATAAPKLIRMSKRLDIDVPEAEVTAATPRNASALVLRKWLPLAQAVLSAAVAAVPSPAEAQAYRAELLLPRGPELAEGAAPPEAPGAPLPPVRAALESCSAAADAPVVAFVSKLFGTSRRELLCLDGRPWRGDLVAGGTGAQEEGETEGDDIVLVAFARVFSGTLSGATPLYSLPRDYHPLLAEDAGVSPVLVSGGAEGAGAGEGARPSEAPLALFMMMGSGFHAVESVAAGNICAICVRGIERSLRKAGTLSSSTGCPALVPLLAQAVPFVRVAVMPARQGDLTLLERGLAKLHQAEPAAEVSVTDKGEHIVAALGELHLEHCLKDLRERYAKGVDFTSSEPLVTFRETVVAPERDAESDKLLEPSQMLFVRHFQEEAAQAAVCRHGLARVVDAKRTIAISVRCAPLPEPLAHLLDGFGADAEAVLAALAPGADGGPPGDADKMRDRAEAFAAMYESAVRGGEDAGGGAGLAAALGVEPEALLAPGAILALGPKRSGPNLLLAPRGKTRLQLHPGAGGVPDDPSAAAEDPACVEEPVGALRSPLLADLWRIGSAALATAFQLSCGAGVVAGEALYGVCFCVERVEAALLDDGGALAASPGATIAAARAALRIAQMSLPARLVEAFYRCDVQCHSEAMGKCCAVLGKRRADIEEEDIIEGTQFFMLRATLPMAESFGLAQELLVATSGAATTPQLALSHWQRLEQDPFWRPRSEEEREEEGEASVMGTSGKKNLAKEYVAMVRKRKGLATEDKVVVDGTKQRTLARKK